MMFPFLFAFMIFISVLALLRNRASHAEKERTEAFWDRESKANRTRKADLSELTYININLEDYPLGIDPDPEILSCEKELKELSSLKMLNLNGQSNTDLKLKYGPQNLSDLTIFDQNFARFEQLLVRYGTLLKDKKHLSEAIQVLEKGIACRTDITANFLLLGELYAETGKPEMIDGLLSMTDSLNEFNRKSTTEKLENLKAGFPEAFRVLK